MVKRALFIIGLLLISLLLAWVSQARAANYPLEIIQPRPGLTSGSTATNRFYKAYPGIEYNVKVAVIGGAWPFTYSLSMAPVGMTINASTGVITWPSPQPSSSTSIACFSATGCPVTVQVVDSEGTNRSVLWYIWVPNNVTTPAASGGFLFVDDDAPVPPACNVRTGPDANVGSISRPLKSINDWYCGSKGNASYAGYIVYYRGGTYTNNTPITSDLQMNVPATKPAVHLCYPGETCVIDWNDHNGIHPDAQSDGMYWDGFEFKNAHFWDTWFETGTNTTFRRNIFSAPTTTGSAINGNNPAGVFLGSSSCNTSYPNYPCIYTSITENIFQNRPGYAVLMYQWRKILIAENTFQDFSNPSFPSTIHVLGFKGEPRDVDARNNTFLNITGDTLDSLITAGNGRAPGNIELRFNLVKNTSGLGLHWNTDSPCSTSPTGPVYVYRDTFVGGSIRFNCATATNGPYAFYDNVVQSSNSAVQCSGCSVAVDTHSGHNLLAASGLVDSSGYLIDRTKVGQYGFELSGTAPPSQTPSPITNLRANP